MAADSIYPDSSEYVDPAGTQSPAEAAGRQALVTTTATPIDFYPNYDFLNSTDFPDVDDADPEQRILGGKAAWNGQFPHQVSLQDSSGKHFCGASVIHAWLLLTAAHCFTGDKAGNIRAVTGALNLTNYNGSEQFRDVRGVIRHEHWNETTFDNDIAIVVLNESLVFDTYTKPIDILDKGISGKKGAYVSGWGYTKNNDTVATAVLQWVMIAFRNRTDCRLKYANRPSKPVNITENMICAGGIGADSCKGDSGGPLTCLTWNPKKNPDERFLCGIVSFGVGCMTRLPGIYTDVSKYYDWIMKHIHAWSQHHYMTSLGKPLFGGAQCGANMSRCENSGACIPEEFKCDGINDCDPLAKGKYDEADCPILSCPASKFHCADNSACVPKTDVCNDNNECEDGSDEADCKQP